VACNPTKGPPSLKDGIDEGQWARIELLFHKNGRKNVDDIARWYEIWRILFPGVQEPSTARGYNKPTAYQEWSNFPQELSSQDTWRDPNAILIS
jgi:hypothetical protein